MSRTKAWAELMALLWYRYQTVSLTPKLRHSYKKLSQCPDRPSLTLGRVNHQTLHKETHSDTHCLCVGHWH
jgi:hypothetical protein